MSKIIRVLPTMPCNPILIVERAKEEKPELYKKLADEYYKTSIGAREFLEQFKSDLPTWNLANAIVALR